VRNIAGLADATISYAVDPSRRRVSGYGPAFDMHASEESTCDTAPAVANKLKLQDRSFSYFRC
jgi:hypothetical protein